MARSELFVVRLSADERDSLRDAAALLNLSPSEFARQQILPEAERVMVKSAWEQRDKTRRAKP